MTKPLVIAAAVVGLGAIVFGGVALKHSFARSSAIEAHLDQARSALDDEAKWSKGLEACRAALKIDPEHAPALLLAGGLELRLGLLKDARADLGHAIEKLEGAARATALVDLGRACAAQYRGSSADADFRAARDAFQEARFDPAAEPDALEGYATLFLDKGRNRDLDKARATLEELVKKYPQSEAAKAAEEPLGLLRKSSVGH